MHAVLECLVVVGVMGAVGSGCATRGADHGGQREDHGDSRSVPASDDCSSRVNAQIESREIPNADREYFIRMCELNR